MKNCNNCKHLYTVDICAFCDINGSELEHPFFMGGKKCPCYEKRVKEKERFEYPKK